MVVQSCYQRALIVDQPGTNIDSHDDNRDDYFPIKVEGSKGIGCRKMLTMVDWNPT